MEQLSAFGSAIESLQKNNAIAKGSKLKHLNPFRDQNGLLHVRDRLRHTDLQCDTKHPLLLPPRSKLTELIILHEHIRHCHAGRSYFGCNPSELLAAQGAEQLES